MRHDEIRNYGIACLGALLLVAGGVHFFDVVLRTLLIAGGVSLIMIFGHLRFVEGLQAFVRRQHGAYGSPLPLVRGFDIPGRKSIGRELIVENCRVAGEDETDPSRTGNKGADVP